MSQDANTDSSSNLCYLDARKVTLPDGVLAELSVVTSEGEPVGSIAGVLIEAAARRVRYYDVRSAGWLRPRRHLIDASQLAQVDPEQKVLRLLTPEVDDAEPDLSGLHEFSDDDLLRVMFSPRAA